MNPNRNESGYELIDSGNQEKLERFGEYLFARPSAQAVWPKRDPGRWAAADAVFQRESSGTGTWNYRRPIPGEWEIAHAGLRWRLHHNEHGNTGIFPEQTDCWEWLRREVTGASAAAGGCEILNLFAYTGGSTLAAAQAGARVCHVDASPSSVQQARDNAALSGAAELPVRWIIEDAARFVGREVRRGRRYQGLILDPPTYGRGTRGEVWKIDEHMLPLLEACRELLGGGRPPLLLLTSHSPGYTPLVLANLLGVLGAEACESGEMTVVDGAGRPLPSGAYARRGFQAARP